MSYATVYDMQTGHTITDGLQSSTVCDAAMQTARQVARDRRRSVIVEDRGSAECYRVTPSGRRWRAPRAWTPEWQQQVDD